MYLNIAHVNQDLLQRRFSFASCLTIPNNRTHHFDPDKIAVIVLNDSEHGSAWLNLLSAHVTWFVSLTAS